MSEFLTDLTWKQVGIKSYIVKAPLVYKSDLLGASVTVPAGFPTDGESCPRWLPIVNSLFGDVADEGAVVHDWLYYTMLCDRETADRVLLEAMGTLPDMETWRKYGIFFALRAGGWVAWNEHRKLGHSIRSFKPFSGR